MKEASIKRIWHRSLLGLGLVLAVILFSHGPLYATAFTWSGLAIQGERSDFFPSGEANFEITSNTLTITLTNDTSQELLSIGEVLTGLVWDIENAGVSLTPISAVIDSGSRLVGVGATLQMDLSTEWAFRDDVSVGSLGSYAIGAMGDVLDTETFGPNDRFNTSGNLWPPPSGSPNGVDGGIVGANVNFGSDGFTTQGPVVQGWDGTSTGPGQMIFSFNFSGLLSDNDISNVQPLFGSDGAAPVPEPATLLLLGTGLVGLVGFRKKLKK